MLILYVRNRFYKLKFLGEIQGEKCSNYIHGKYGTAEEAEHYKKFFNEADIIGFKYTSEYPWDFQKNFQILLKIFMQSIKKYQ